MKEITKQEAFTKRDDEVRIHFDKTQYKFRFTRKWFVHRNLTTWSTFLPKKYKRKGRIKPWNMIQIGVFEAYDLCWCMQNILTHPDSRVVAIDPWSPTRKLDAGYMEECYQRAQHNLRPWRKQVKIIRGLSQNVLTDLIENGIEINGIGIKAGDWDLAVTDGDHNAPAVYDDAKNVLELVKKNAWMVFDDVRNQRFKKNHVLHGLRKFTEEFSDKLKLEWQHRFCDAYSKR